MSIEYYTAAVDKVPRLTDAEMRPLMATSNGRQRLVLEVIRLALIHFASLQRSGKLPPYPVGEKGPGLSAADADEGFDQAVSLIWRKLGEWNPTLGTLNTFLSKWLDGALMRAVWDAQRETEHGPAASNPARSSQYMRSLNAPLPTEGVNDYDDDGEDAPDAIEDVVYADPPIGLGDPLDEMLRDEQADYMQQLADGAISVREYCRHTFGPNYTAAQLRRAYDDQKRVRDLLN